VPTSVTVRGDERLAATLTKAQADLADLTRANSEVAHALANRVQSLAPKVTGRLAASVWGQGLPDRAVVYAGAVYAGPINFGWAARNISPNPFLTDPVESAEPLAVPAYSAEVGRILSQVKGV